MVTIDVLINRFQQASDGLDGMITEAVDETSTDLVKKNVKQLYAGKLNDDEPIEPPYAESTVKRKKRKGQPYNRVTTRDTGAYHEGMTAKREGDEIVIGSDVEYETYLDKKYSKKLYGLTPANNEAYSLGPFAKALIKKLERVTKLPFDGQ